MKPKIIEETPLCMSEVKELLGKIKKRDEELNFRANKTEEYINTIDVLSAKQAKELKAKLESLDVPRLKNQHILKIIDTLPFSVDDLKVILQGYTITVNNDNMKKIVGAVAEFIPKKK